MMDGRSRRARAWSVVVAVGLMTAACTGGSGAGESGPTAPQTPAAAEGDGELVLGTLLPRTGDLAHLGPGQLAGVKAAVEDINAAGGVNGTPVVHHDVDSGDTPQSAAEAVQSLLDDDSDVIIGAASSAESMAVVDQVTAAGTVLLSASSTAPDLSRHEDGGLFFRTVPSDVLQGRVLGELLVEDGREKVGVLARDDVYGKGLSANLAEALRDGDRELASDPILYGAKSSLSAEVTRLKSAGPDAIVLVGFAETSSLVAELAAQGIGPDTVPLYLVDANLTDYSDDLPEGLLDGVKGTLPGAEVPGPLQAKFRAAEPSATVLNHAPQAYDAAVIAALAARAAGDDSGASVASAMAAVTTGGRKCTDVQGCLALLDEGADIDYDGVSGPLELDAWGDPTEGVVGVYQYGPDNTPASRKFVTGTL